MRNTCLATCVPDIDAVVDRRVRFNTSRRLLCVGAKACRRPAFAPSGKLPYLIIALQLAATLPAILSCFALEYFGQVECTDGRLNAILA